MQQSQIHWFVYKWEIRWANLQIWEHAQKTPQETAVYGLSTPLSLNKKQNPIDCLTLHLQVADDIETKQLQAHVPEDKTQEYH